MSEAHELESDRRFWLAFNLVRGIGAVRLRALIEHFGSANAAWEAQPEALRDAGMGTKTIARLLALRADLDVDRLWQETQNRGVQVLTSDDPAYPSRLREIEQPPPVLFVRGE